MEKIQGLVERILFHSPDTKYTVLKLKTSTQQATAVGKIDPALLGQEVELLGTWTVHSQYGRQFAFEQARSSSPFSVQGLEKYLGSGIIKGIGPETAKRIVLHFGSAVLDVLEKDPSRLQEVSGIGEAKATSIGQAFSSQSALRDAMVFLQGHGISPGYAGRIFRQYGSECERLLRENPYRMADEVHGIGFRTADRLAQELGLKAEDPRRIAAGVQFALKSAEDQGHCYLPENLLVGRTAELLIIDEAQVTPVLERLVLEQYLFRVRVSADERIYRPEVLQAEREVARRVLQLLRSKVANAEIPPDELATVEANNGLVFAAEQRQAVQSAFAGGVTVITGGPGTGKTTLIKAVLQLAQGRGLEVALAAPTGRAAKRMSESTGYEARTLHRLLEYAVKENRFLRDETNPLACDLLIIDEASMVDLNLMHALLRSVCAGCGLVLVGDVDQLPSVGAGNVLRDLIGSGMVPYVRLQVIYRQAEESMIVSNAHRINQGEFPDLRGKKRDFVFINAQEPEKAASIILETVSKRLPKFNRLHPIDDIQVLSPMRKSITGVDALNVELQKVLNPPSPGKPELRIGPRIIRLGDKVMQIKNNYNKMVFNGDIGRVSGIDAEEGILRVTYTDGSSHRTVNYDFTECDEITVAYAISVHKSQGSEYRAVVMPLTTQHYMMLQRNLLYTAVTRAREQVIIIGSGKAMAIAVRNAKTEERYSSLKELLRRGDE